MNKYNRIIWDDDKISSFWDFEINFKKNEDNWFTNLKGDGILNYANKYFKFKPLISEGVNFSHYNKNNLTSILKRLKAKFSNQKRPHRIYIGVK